jgi:DME family drug/metabolite transporter
MTVRRRASSAVIGAAVLFGTTGTAQGLGPAGTTPVGVGTLRIAVGAVALWAFARRWPDPALLRRHLGLFVVAGCGVAVYQPAFFTGTARSGVALGTIVALGGGPLFAGLLETVSSRRLPRPTWWAATLLTVAGGALVVVGTGTAGATVDVVGLLCSLAAGAGYAVYAVAAARLIRAGVPSTVALAWPFTLGAVLLLPTLVGEPLGWVPTVAGAAMLLHLGVATVGVAYVLYGFGLRSLDASTAVTLTLAEPLTAALLGVVVLGERLRPAGWAGAVLVLAGLAVAGGVADRQRSYTRNSTTLPSGSRT